MIGLAKIFKGGYGSGNFGHSGRDEENLPGGSAPSNRPKVRDVPEKLKPGIKPIKKPIKPGQKPSSGNEISDEEIRSNLSKSGLVEEGAVIAHSGFGNGNEAAKAFAVANNVYKDLTTRFSAVAESGKLKGFILVNGEDLTIKDGANTALAQYKKDFKGTNGIYFRQGKQIMAVSTRKGWTDPNTPFIGDGDDGTQYAPETFRHEIGHNFQETSSIGKKMFPEFRKAYLKLSEEQRMEKISMYGAVCDLKGKPMAEEGFAECFRIYTHPNYKGSKIKLPKGIESIFNKYLGGEQKKELEMYDPMGTHVQTIYFKWLGRIQKENASKVNREKLSDESERLGLGLFFKVGTRRSGNRDHTNEIQDAKNLPGGSDPKELSEADRRRKEASIERRAVGKGMSKVTCKLGKDIVEYDKDGKEIKRKLNVTFYADGKKISQDILDQCTKPFPPSWVREGKYIPKLDAHGKRMKNKKGESMFTFVPKTNKDGSLVPVNNPRAYTGMWIQMSEKAAAKVDARTGKLSYYTMALDARGFEQNGYLKNVTAKRQIEKFLRIDDLQKDMRKVSIANDANIRSKDLELRDNACILRLLANTAIRPGSDKDTGATVKAYGATTLEGRHVLSGKGGMAKLAFGSKKGGFTVSNVLSKDASDDLFKRKSVSGKNGKLFGNTNYMSFWKYTKTLSKTTTKNTYTPKDFRTLAATDIALKAVRSMAVPTNKTARKKAVKAVALIASTKLGNTPAVCLKSYINPKVFDDWPQFEETSKLNRRAGK